MANAATSIARFLVALDGSRLAETVLPLTQTLANALHARVTLLYVLEHEPPATIHGEPHLTTVDTAEAYLAKLAERVRKAGLVVETHVHPNPERDVAGSIAAHAGELEADLIALAAHGRGRVRDLLVGRIPQQVAARARRPVLIVPAPQARTIEDVQRVMVPVDLAGEAAAGIPLAQRIAIACQAEIILVTVVPTPEAMPGDAGVVRVFLPRTTAALLDWAVDEARDRLEQTGKALTESGISVTSGVRRGEPAREILAAVMLYEVDLIVLATHARAGLDGLLAGSVGPRVVGSAQCPVLLVPIGIPEPI
ncbi:MAG: universal stress protein [Chloroflexi bacterium]|nr:universal stress protein [Chloroflexota bacterium]